MGTEMGDCWFNFIQKWRYYFNPRPREGNDVCVLR